MPLVEAILELLRAWWMLWWSAIFGVSPRERDQTEHEGEPPRGLKSALQQAPGPESQRELDTAATQSLEHSDVGRDLGQPQMQRGRDGDADEEEDVSDSFLQQLEQRTQQVKITLANLEAERTRIEGLIARLQPLVPQYDALLEAERRLSEAQVYLEPALPAGGGEHQTTAEGHPPSWEEQHSPAQQEHGWGG